MIIELAPPLDRRLAMRAGILIIGSLLWDDGYREVWRRSHLRLDEKFHVNVPIRYGRRSTSRGKTFTMTYARDGRLGQGVVVPCHSALTHDQDLICEAKALWRAEKHDASTRGISEPWGCVGVMFRKSSCSSTAWSDYFYKNGKAVWPVNAEGELSLSWPAPTTAEVSTDVDVILTTATKAETDLPGPDQIAGAWLSQESGHENYFFANVRNGIRTSEDGLIWKNIETANPRWIETSAYQEAIAILRSEEPA